MSQTSQELPKVRHDWYQTETHVIVNILSKNVKESDFEVKYDTDSVFVAFGLENEVKHNLNFKLLHEINPSECTHKLTPSKIEIKLKKKEDIRWTTLENDGTGDKAIKQSMSKTLEYPSSSLKPKDWDKVIVDITKNDNDPEEGEVNALFQKIYSEGSDDVKKAMNKSFVESGGTVLSTNWGEVKREKVAIKPPDGMEWKTWNS